MTDNRNTIIAVILSGLVLIGWQYFYNIPQMEKQRAQTATQTQLANPTAQPNATPGSTTPTANSTAAGGAPTNVAPANAPIVSRDSAIAASQRVKIDTPRISGSIALKGARLDDISLTKFRDTVDPKSPAIVLFSPPALPRLIMPSSAGSPPPVRTPRFPTRTPSGSRKAPTP